MAGKPCNTHDDASRDHHTEDCVDHWTSGSARCSGLSRERERQADGQGERAPMLNTLQHSLKALHVMAFLIGCGVGQRRALCLARRWERAVHPWLYRRHRHKSSRAWDS